MPLPPPRIYVDTSVFGGCFDEEFSDNSVLLFGAARDGRCVLVLSSMVVQELAHAPSRVRGVLAELPEELYEVVKNDEEVLELAHRYIEAGIVSAGCLADAVHVASATVHRCDAIVSWYLRHIVRLDRIRRYNDVNEKMGYRHLTILTPREVIHEPRPDEDEDL